MCYMLYLAEATTTVSVMPTTLPETIQQHIIVVTLDAFSLEMVSVC